MTRSRLLAFNALAMLVANIISKFVLFFGSIFLFQYLSPGLESTYYLVTAFAALVTMNYQDGMVYVTIRRIATDHENGPHHLGTCYLASMLIGLLLGIIAIPGAFYYAHTQFRETGLQGQFILSTAALTATYIVGYLAACAGAGFKAYEKLSLEAVLVVFQSMLNALIYIIGSYQQWTLASIFFGLFATNVVYVIITNLILSAYVTKVKFHFNIHEAWLLFRESVGLGNATLLRTLQDRMHPFFIDKLAGHNMITQFASPNNFLIQFKFIPTSIRPALFPTLARKAEENTDSFEKYSAALMKFLYLVGIPLIILLIIARYQLLSLVTTIGPNFAEQYKLALMVYPVVAWAVALSFPSQVLRSLFVALKHPEYEFRSVFAGVIILGIIDFVLIPRIGVMGAAAGAVACELTIFFFGLWLLHRIGRGLNLINLFILPTLCGIITNLLAEWLYGIHWLLGVASVLVVFPALVLAFRIIVPHEWAIIREVIKPSIPQQ